MPPTYNSKTKNSLSLILKPPPKGTSNPGKCAFNYQPKDYRRRGGKNVCLIYLVHCVSSSRIHSPNPSRKHFPSQAGIAKGLYPDTINLGLDEPWELNDTDRLDWGLDALTKHFDISGQCNFCLTSNLFEGKQATMVKSKQLLDR